MSEEGAVSVKVLPCCIFGMNRLVTSVREGLGRIEGITKAEVDVAGTRSGTGTVCLKRARECSSLT